MHVQVLRNIMLYFINKLINYLFINRSITYNNLFSSKEYYFIRFLPFGDNSCGDKNHRIIGSHRITKIL